MPPGPPPGKLESALGEWIRTWLVGALLLVALVAAPAAGATVVQAGTACPDTLPGQGPLKACFGEPFSEARPEGIGPSGAPDDDLSAALRRMASAPDPDTAAAARRDALDILEGNAFAAGSPLAGSAYEGISLLHWDAASKIQDVPAGGTVTVREVRFGDHAITDTARLHFEDPARPFRIRYEITELGTSMGGDLAPAALQSDGGTPTQSHVAGVTPLALPLLDLGTMQVGRFHDPVHKTFPLSDNNPQPERTRIGTEEVDVDMPAPSSVDVILDPDQRPDHHTLVALRPTDKPAPDAPAGKAAGIDTIGDAAPEKKLWTGIHALDPQAPTFLADAKAVASGDASLVGEMRVRNALPAGVITDPGADLYVVLLNNEVYVSANGLRLAPGAPLRVQFVNADDRPHDLSALQLHGRVPHIGALDWGSFLHDALTGVPGTLPAGERTPVQQLSLDDDAFELV